MTVTGPLLPLVAEEFGTSVGEAGAIVSAFAIPYGACQILFGPVGDRLGKLRVIAGALAVSSLFVLASGFSESLQFLTSMRFVCGFFMAATVPLALAYIADEVAYAERQPVIGRFVHGLVMGQIAGGVLGGIAGEYFNWRDIFFVFGGLGIVLAVLLARRAVTDHASGSAVHHKPRELLRFYRQLCIQPSSRDLLFVATVEGAMVFGLLAYLGAYLRHEFGLNYAVIGLVLSSFGVGGVVYATAVYRLVRILGERRMILAGAALVSVGYLGLQAVPHWLWCPPLLLLAGFGFYMIHNTLQTRATEMSDTARGTAVSLWAFMLFFGQGVGVLVFGRLIDSVSYASAFYAAAIGMFAVGLWFFLRLKRYAPHVQHA